MAVKKPTAGKSTASQIKTGQSPSFRPPIASETPVLPKPTPAPIAGQTPKGPVGPGQVTPPVVIPTTPIPLPPISAGQSPNFAPPPPPPASLSAQNTGTSGRLLAENILRSKGIKEGIIKSSLDFIDEIKFDFGTTTKDIDTAIDVLLYSPEYTTKAGKKLTSPYYEMYGKFAKYASGENKLPSVLTGLIDDFRDLPKAYGLPAEFGSDATIEKAFQNKVDLATLDKRYAQAQVAALVADPFVVESAKQQGFINNTKDLIAFYADAGIGEAQMQRNKIQNALGTETLRQGMKINAANLAKTAGELQLRGFDEATAAANAAKDMSTVAEQLQPITTYSGVYEGKLAGTTEQIQQELVNEQMLGQASTRRKRLEEMNKAAYQGRSGTTNVSLSKSIQL